MAGALALFAAGCGQGTDSTTAEEGGMRDTAAGQHTVETNVMEDGVATDPGAGSAVGADPSGAGTQPLRNDPPPTP